MVSGTAALGTEVLEARSGLEVRSDLEALALRLGSGVLALRLGLEALEPPSLVLSFSAKIIKEQLTRISLDNQPYLTQELLTTHTPGSKRDLNFTTISCDRFAEKTTKGAAAAAPLII
ncbi:hypothetical protein PC41400_03735 [Paenibacillus chitinolyticus]|uniref:Uncharacterized protein n=1 Tax=Paenibacillus chitinolyticus TaxID=79263 RepID=A0A410X510_9BACL|nr:hypothetical protein [Paenibacillus chitinolyticus]MCY9591566.1 hypothetical protein [Paenibacillus chitinolyticus]MCY9594601.1 hypothetical protein [Paenibacillus chitinolyticus]QAV21624.1 hypothetical protein PC41400_03735 [Paenibacillus chitinolyticus]